MRSSPLRHPARLAGASLLRLQSDSRLAELAVAGHAAAFETIVDRYRTPLLRYCAGIVGPSRAEDAVQQAQINAHDALKRTDEVRHLRSWLYRIAHNASLNVLRAVRDDVPLEEASLPLDAAGAPGPAESFETSERFRATVEALRELPERQRAALVLRELEGRSHEEIAEALGVSKGSARQHLMRARVAMRGAVTAITPYPIVARLAEALASPGGAGWTDAAVGAGTGATLAKLTAGVAATGALVGGAVGTREVVHHHRGTPSASAETPRKATTVRAPVVRHATPIVLPATPAPARTPAARGDRAGAEHHATPRRGSDDRRHDRDPDRARDRHDDHPAAATVPPQPATSGPGSVPSRDSESGSSHRDDSGPSRHGSRKDAPKRDSSGKGSSGGGSSGKGPSRDDSSGKGTSGKGKHEDGDDTPTATLPTSTLPAPPPPTDTSGSGSSSGGSGSGDSGSNESGSDSSGSGSSGSSGSNGSSDDGSTTVPAGG